MLIFCACLLAMFLFWLLGDILDTFLYLGILFVDHLISYWYFYLPLIILISLAILLHQKCLSDAGANYSHSFTCVSINDILAAPSQFITK